MNANQRYEARVGFPVWHSPGVWKETDEPFWHVQNLSVATWIILAVFVFQLKKHPSNTQKDAKTLYQKPSAPLLQAHGSILQ